MLSNSYRRANSRLIFLIILFIFQLNFAYGQLLPGGQLDRYESSAKPDEGGYFSHVALKSQFIYSELTTEIMLASGFDLSRRSNLGFYVGTEVSRGTRIPIANNITRPLWFIYTGALIEYFIVKGNKFNILACAMTGPALYDISGTAGLALGMSTSTKFYLSSELNLSGIYTFSNAVNLQIGAGYRMAAFADNNLITSNDLTGFTLTIGIRSKLGK